MNPLELLRDMLAQFSTVPIWCSFSRKSRCSLAAAWGVHFSLARANPRWRTLLWRGVAVGLVLVAVWMPCLPGMEIRIPCPSWSRRSLRLPFRQWSASASRRFLWRRR